MGLFSKLFGNAGAGKPSRTGVFPSPEFSSAGAAIAAMISRQREHWPGGWVSVTLVDHKGDDDPPMIQVGGEQEPEINTLLRRAPELFVASLGLVERKEGLYLVPDADVAQVAQVVEALLAELFHAAPGDRLQIDIDPG
ncbi:MAG: hypothetical protein JNL50_12935 [Phycisphaerae bacterium]|nr:hypothetical protein [Phycisphaerae bacterium]